MLGGVVVWGRNPAQSSRSNPTDIKEPEMAYTQKQREDLQNEICRLIAKGDSLVSICQDKKMPDRETVYRWLRNDAAFRDIYAGAREDQAEHYLDEIIAIADEKTGDVKYDKDGNEIADNEFIQRSRIRIDTRKWVMGKLKPKKYGERTTVAGDSEAPLQHMHKGSVDINLTSEEAYKQLLGDE